MTLLSSLSTTVLQTLQWIAFQWISWWIYLAMGIGTVLLTAGDSLKGLMRPEVAQRPPPRNLRHQENSQKMILRLYQRLHGEISQLRGLFRGDSEVDTPGNVTGNTTTTTTTTLWLPWMIVYHVVLLTAVSLTFGAVYVAMLPFGSRHQLGRGVTTVKTRRAVK